MAVSWPLARPCRGQGRPCRSARLPCRSAHPRAPALCARAPARCATRPCHSPARPLSQARCSHLRPAPQRQPIVSWPWPWPSTVSQGPEQCRSAPLAVSWAGARARPAPSSTIQYFVLQPKNQPNQAPQSRYNFCIATLLSQPTACNTNTLLQYNPANALCHNTVPVLQHNLQPTCSPNCNTLPWLAIQFLAHNTNWAVANFQLSAPIFFFIINIYIYFQKLEKSLKITKIIFFFIFLDT